jgi:hypothetical protein
VCPTLVDENWEAIPSDYKNIMSAFSNLTKPARKEKEKGKKGKVSKPS